MEGRIDKRERRTVQTQMNMGKWHERDIFEYYKERVKAEKWKTDFVNAINLYRELVEGRVEALQVLFPRIIDAVRLFLAIEQGDLSIMRELFPERYQVFRLQLEADILEGINQDTQKDVLKELRNIKAELANLKANGISSQAPQGIGGIKQIGTLTPIADPVFEDEDEDLFGVKKDEKAGERASLNFIASLKRL